MAESKFDALFDKTAPAGAGITPPERNEGKKVGRPVGKKSDPRYKQYSALLLRDTRNQVEAKLTRKFPNPDQRPDFSDLVQERLDQWLSEPD